MISKIAPPQIRATTGLELAAGLFTECSDELASPLTVSLTSGQKESAQTPLRIGINGDVYGAVKTIDERKKMIPVDDDQPLDMRNLCRSTEKCSLQIPLHPGALKYYKEKGHL